MLVTLLDGVSVTRAQGSRTLLQHKPGAVLFALIAKGPLPSDELLEAAWTDEDRPDDRRRPAKVISDLNRPVDGRVFLGPAGYDYKPRVNDLVDLHGWRAWVRRADILADADPHAAHALYLMAARKWRRLPALPATPFMERLAEGMREEWLIAQERHAEIQLGLGLHRRVIDQFGKIVRDWPGREHPAELLMRALHQAQRPLDALEIYARHRDYLRSVADASPTPILQDLREKIRSGGDTQMFSPPPPLPAADQAVARSGGILDRVVSSRMTRYLTDESVGGYDTRDQHYHTAADRAAIEAILAVVPLVREIQGEASDFLARLVRHLTLTEGIQQFIEVGALPGGRRSTHAEARRPRPDTRVLYLNSSSSAVRHGQALVEDLEGVECRVGTVRTVVEHFEEIPLIDWSVPVAILSIYEPSAVDEPEYGLLLAQLGDRLARGSWMTIVCAATEDVAPGMGWALSEAYRDADGDFITRTRDEMIKLIPPEWKAPRGVVSLSSAWEELSGLTARIDLKPGPLPRWTFTAYKP
ncbi:SAM-dependent methyltransferase [Actinomadura litoris]|uniref:SAM-dependent methyltransferase n=1 Tax=Actinomadura litoris TaxID=2678616 RepID=UPI001FA7C5CF|nr:SAM-dependent methyltransferase [Actinomadura litoris]